MRRRQWIAMGLVLVGSLSTLATPVFAQETVPATTAAAPSWIVYAIFVVGLIGIGLVGLSQINRRSLSARFAPNTGDEELIDEDDVPAKE